MNKKDYQQLKILTQQAWKKHLFEKRMRKAIGQLANAGLTILKQEPVMPMIFNRDF